MQIATVAFVFAQGFGDCFGENARIGQMLELLIIIANKADDFPMFIAQSNMVQFSQSVCDIVIPIRQVDQKTLIVCFRQHILNHQNHDWITGLLTVNVTSPA